MTSTRQCDSAFSVSIARKRSVTTFRWSCLIRSIPSINRIAVPPAPTITGLSPALSAWRATFVTLTENERLRGCIGSLEPRRPLIDDAVANTTQAALSDPRFPPLKESELTGLRLDVSILSHPRPIPAGRESELAAALEPDRDGLILSAGTRRALFLPGVWRHLPDARAFVRHLMAKAGFDSNRWLEGLEARRFRVESLGAPWRRVDAKDVGLEANDAKAVQH